MIKKIITTPLYKNDVKKLIYGDGVLLSGVIYTARDAAHKRLIEAMENGKSLPFEIENAIVYYVGPTPSKPGDIIGSAGPTTSGRMDIYTPALIKAGMTGMIGKGSRSPDVLIAMQQYGAIYFGALGGAGALLSRCITSSEIVEYEDLGAEAIQKVTIKNMPLIVAIDCDGNNLYKIGREDYTRRS